MTLERIATACHLRCAHRTPADKRSGNRGKAPKCAVITSEAKCLRPQSAPRNVSKTGDHASADAWRRFRDTYTRRLSALTDRVHMSAHPSGTSSDGHASRAGHTSVSVVLDRYGHLLPGTEDRVNDALDSLVRASAPARRER